MANTQLRVTRRTVLGKKVKALRRDGVTPANIYGHKLESLAVQAMTPEVTHALRTSSRNAIFDLTVEGDGGTRPAVVRDIHRDPVTGRILHIDFFQISMTEKMRADVRVVLTGTSPAVSTYGGVLLQTLDSVAVEALPGDIPPQFEIDVSTLTELEQSVHVRDLAFDAEKVTKRRALRPPRKPRKVRRARKRPREAKELRSPRRAPALNGWQLAIQSA
jgi:large subunit ribosomal protein L25